MKIKELIKKLEELRKMLGDDAEVYVRNDIGEFTTIDVITGTLNADVVIDGKKDYKNSGVRPQ